MVTFDHFSHGSIGPISTAQVPDVLTQTKLVQLPVRLVRLVLEARQGADHTQRGAEHIRGDNRGIDSQA